MKLFTFNPFEETEAFVTAYLHDPIPRPDHRTKYPVVVVCPGGGYGFCSPTESDPVMTEYFSAGYNVFVLNYSVGDMAKDFNPLKELSLTIMAVRENAEKWNCISDNIAVCGFSAGGHLAASVGTLWNNPKFLEQFDNKNGLNMPNAMILCYPVICEGKYSHQGSIEKVSGNDPELAKFFSLEKRVTKETCPCFIWHTVNDGAVPIQNSLFFINALQEQKIPYECHLFPDGRHGLTVCVNETSSKHTHNRQWVNLSVNYLNDLFKFEY